MRILVHADSLAPGRRLALAAAGLARRGHRVTWAGEAPPEAGIPAARGPREAARLKPDLVLAGSRAPFRSGLLARLSGAGAVVLDLEPAQSARWPLPARWALASLHALALIEPADSEAARAARSPVPVERIALWPDGPAAAEVEAAHPDTEVLERACERAFRRRRGHAPVPAVFLDRDGTLVVERGYLTDPEDIELIPGVPEALRDLRSAGYLLVVISNQSGVGRGFFSEETVHAAMARLRGALRERGVELDAIYFCPHRPEAGCPCRKPGTGLLERAEGDLELDLSRSVMVGDKLLDAETGRRAGARGLLVRTGYGRDEEQRLLGGGAEWLPDAVVDDLRGAAGWILGPAAAAAGGPRA